ncbi:MAG: DNA repair and recombination protein RadB [Halobacteriaceae archaeon]
MTDGGVPTGCDPLDELLGDGLERGAVTQFYGPPAAGKTNVALSAAVEVAVDGGTAVYIDTEGLSVDRFHQVLDGCTDDVDAAADRIIISAAHDFDEQAEAVRDIEDLASQADLVVLDSATGFYRVERANDAEGGETLRRVADQVTHLLGLARRYDFAVLLTNQVYTDPDTDRTRPLGGHTLQHWTATVVRLERFRGGNRRATLESHRSKSTGESIQFKITDAGITGVDRSH